jgi:hypothetical protein
MPYEMANILRVTPPPSNLEGFYVDDVHMDGWAKPAAATAAAAAIGALTSWPAADYGTHDNYETMRHVDATAARGVVLQRVCTHITTLMAGSLCWLK